MAKQVSGEQGNSAEQEAESNYHYDAPEVGSGNYYNSAPETEELSGYDPGLETPGGKRPRSSGKGKQRKPEDQLADERYKKQRDVILAQKLKSRVKRGSIPWRSSVARYEMSPDELFHLWYKEHGGFKTEGELKRAMKRFKRLGATTDSS